MYAAPLGARERLATIAGVVFGVVVFTGVGVVLAALREEPAWLALSLPFVAALWVMGRYAPLGYRLGADGVRVERRAGPRVIPYRAIRGADRAPRPVAGLSVWGSRGIFGRFGTFWNLRLGFYRLFLSDADHVVWLLTDRGLIGLSPDRPDEFLERLRGRLEAGG